MPLDSEMTSPRSSIGEAGTTHELYVSKLPTTKAPREAQTKLVKLGKRERRPSAKLTGSAVTKRPRDNQDSYSPANVPMEAASPRTPAPQATRNLNKQSVKILKDWMFDPKHSDNPYPTDLEKQALSLAAGITKKQLNNWFVNARQRHWTPKPGSKGAKTKQALRQGSGTAAAKQAHQIGPKSPSSSLHFHSLQLPVPCQYLNASMGPESPSYMQMHLQPPENSAYHHHPGLRYGMQPGFHDHNFMNATTETKFGIETEAANPKEINAACGLLALLGKA